MIQIPPVKKIALALLKEQDDEVLTINNDEVNVAITRLKNNKAAATVGQSRELLKILDKILLLCKI